MLKRVPSTVFVGVIVLFTADETLLTAMVWVLALLSGAALIASRFAAGLRRWLLCGVSSPFALLQEITDKRLRLGGFLPARCPVRSVSDRSVPPDRIRPRAGDELRGWHSDGR